MIVDEPEQVVDETVYHLVHIFDACCPPYEAFLCGFEVRHRGRTEPSWDELADCLVCLDLEKEVHFCKRCGSRLMHR